MSRHKERTTWETQGGHIEKGETPLEAAKRELYEESGAIQYEITPLCDYFVGNFEMNNGAGGAVLKVETCIMGAKRELLEEIGIIADELKQIYTKFYKDRFYKGYVCRTNIAKDTIRLQEGETIDYKWVSVDDFLQILKSDEYITSLKNRLKEFVQKYFVESDNQNKVINV